MNWPRMEIVLIAFLYILMQEYVIWSHRYTTVKSQSK